MLVKDAAREAAIKILRDHWDGTFPVDPVEIAEAKGIEVEFARLKVGVSGAIIVTHGNATILIDKEENFGRQMFTCAHELGHYVERKASHDRDFSFVERRSAKYDLHEFYADEFAGNLLMPEAEFRAKWKACKSDILMSSHFGVSTAAIMKRKDRLSIV